jgi:hypothetical protein
MPGPLPRNGVRALTPTERQAARRARLKAAGMTHAWVPAAGATSKPPVVVRYRRPADRRARHKRWEDAVEELGDLLDAYQVWRDSLSRQADSDLTQRLDDVLELRDLVDQLAAADLPKGFGRD